MDEVEGGPNIGEIYKGKVDQIRERGERVRGKRERVENVFSSPQCDDHTFFYEER